MVSKIKHRDVTYIYSCMQVRFMNVYAIIVYCRICGVSLINTLSCSTKHYFEQEQINSGFDLVKICMIIASHCNEEIPTNLL